MYILFFIGTGSFQIKSGKGSKGNLKDTYLEFRVYVPIETLLKSVH